MMGIKTLATNAKPVYASGAAGPYTDSELSWFHMARNGPE
jgi:hypothetical protein